MINVTRRLFAALAAAALIGAWALPAAAQKAELTLLHFNDVYEISPKHGRGGLAELMTLLEIERQRADYTMTTFGGDLISPSVMSGLTKGAQMIDLLNFIGVDVAGLGNHEFDFGADVLLQRMADSEFTWVASNTLGPDGEPFGGAQGLVVRKVGDLTIGVFSVLTAETTHLSSPGSGVRFTDVTATSHGAVKLLKEAGADFIIALTHLDLAADRALAAEVDGIDVILGGHDHDPMAIYEGGTLIVKAGHDAHYLAVVDLVIEKSETKRGPKVEMLPQWRFVSTAGVPPHPGAAPLVASYEAKLDEELGVVVGTTEVELDSRRASVRTAETNVGNLIADAMRDATRADVGFTNGGGIRGDRTYDPGTRLTRKDVLTELPFGNVTVVLELSGADLLEAVENGVSRIEDKAGRFPQVSGMRFTYDPAAAQGARVVAVTVGGQPLDKGKTYRVATNDYIANGGDGYSVFKRGKTIVDASGATLMASQVMDYIEKQGKVAPKVEGRIEAK